MALLNKVMSSEFGVRSKKINGKTSIENKIVSPNSELGYSELS
jgi:hypothetical protein